MKEIKKRKLIERAKRMIEKDLGKNMNDIYKAISDFNNQKIKIEFEIKEK